jgi:hypothetical protein
LRSYAYGAVPVVLAGPSMRSCGWPIVFSWSIGFCAAGWSNFMRQLLACSSTAASVRSTSGSL